MYYFSIIPLCLLFQYDFALYSSYVFGDGLKVGYNKYHNRIRHSRVLVHHIVYAAFAF